MARKQAAQAQAQKEAEITAVESMELVKCLLRVSIYHVSYLRGLFPESCFKGVNMQNLDGLSIKMLLRKEDEEAQRLVDWVEGGVVDAIRKKYLKKLYFGFSSDPDARQLLEEYVFSFGYDMHGSVSMALGTRGKASKFAYKHSEPGGEASEAQANQSQRTVNGVKFQVVRLMRMLVGICQTLEKVPDERYLFMKLSYCDHTPDEYEPPFFEAAGDKAVGTFNRKPFTMQVGKVDTDHHNIALHVKSVLDAMDAVHGHLEPEADCGSVSLEQGDTELSDVEDPEESMGGAHSPKDDQQHNDLALAGLYTEPAEPQDEDAPCSAAKPKAGCDPVSLEKVAAYVGKRAKVHLVDAMAYFADISSSQLEVCFKQLVEDGVLERTIDPETYAVVEHDFSKRMAGLAVGKPVPLPSQAGGMHEMPGSAATQSQAVTSTAAGGKRKAAAVESSPPPENVWVDGTQPSQTGAAAAANKTSLVERLIHQRAKKPKTQTEPPKRMLLRSRMGAMER